MNKELLQTWLDRKDKIFVYTLTVRLHGIITAIHDNSLTLDNHTIVIFNNVISISDTEQSSKKF